MLISPTKNRGQLSLQQQQTALPFCEATLRFSDCPALHDMHCLCSCVLQGRWSMGQGGEAPLPILLETLPLASPRARPSSPTSHSAMASDCFNCFGGKIIIRDMHCLSAPATGMERIILWMSSSLGGLLRDVGLKSLTLNQCCQLS